MSDNSKIEWTDASWTPIRAFAPTHYGPRYGWHCEHVSEGCRNCYAERMNLRLGTRFEFKPANLTQPLRWKRARKIFVCSMTDLFAGFVQNEWIDRMFAVMALCPHHTFQVLTKRPERMLEYFSDRRAAYIGALMDQPTWCELPRGRTFPRFPEAWPLPHVWLGVSVEDQATADDRIPLLLQTPAAVRFISAEPLLGPIDLCNIRTPNLGDGHEYAGADVLTEANRQMRGCIDWIIAGGESGPGARPSHPDWFRSLRDQCAAASVPFHFKQWGEWLPALCDGDPDNEGCASAKKPPVACSMESSTTGFPHERAPDHFQRTDGASNPRRAQDADPAGDR